MFVRHPICGTPTSQLRRGDAMSATVLYMSISLDGFIAGRNERVDNGLGDGGRRLHDWLTDADADHTETLVRSGVNGQIVDELMSTGAVVAGRGTFEPAGGWGGDTTTERRSSSSPARTPPISSSGRWSPT
jgi:dihydrofolate reductase